MYCLTQSGRPSPSMPNVDELTGMPAALRRCAAAPSRSATADVYCGALLIANAACRRDRAEEDARRHDDGGHADGHREPARLGPHPPIERPDDRRRETGRRERHRDDVGDAEKPRQRQRREDGEEDRLGFLEVHWRRCSEGPHLPLHAVLYGGEEYAAGRIWAGDEGRTLRAGTRKVFREARKATLPRLRRPHSSLTFEADGLALLVSDDEVVAVEGVVHARAASDRLRRDHVPPHLVAARLVRTCPANGMSD